MSSGQGKPHQRDGDDEEDNHNKFTGFSFKNPSQTENSSFSSHVKIDRPPMLQMNFMELADSRSDRYFNTQTSMLNLGIQHNISDFKENFLMPQGGSENMTNSCLPFKATGSINPLSISVFEKDEQNQINQEYNLQEQFEQQKEQQTPDQSKEEIDEQSQDEKQTDNEPKEFEGCKCTNSKCLKLYCICFGKELHCGDKCKCQVCCNKEGFESEIREAKKSAILRNPNAFTSKVELISTNISSVDHNPSTLGYKSGCKCKKTFCKKKYCECFNAGVKCSYLCICENCQNKEDEQNEETPSKQGKKRAPVVDNLENEEDESESVVGKKKRNKSKKLKIDLRDQEESSQSKKNNSQFSE